MLVHLEDLNLPAQKIEFLQSFHETEKLFVKGKHAKSVVVVVVATHFVFGSVSERSFLAPIDISLVH